VHGVPRHRSGSRRGDSNFDPTRASAGWVPGGGFHVTVHG
jgi:hypothetical protein